MRMRQHTSAAQASHSQHQNPRVPLPIISLTGGSITKSLPRIPKFSQSNSHASNTKAPRDNEERNRDPRSRRNKEESSLKSSKSSPSSKDKIKGSSSKTSSSSSRSSDRKKSASSDDSSPRKKSEDEKRTSKSSSSHHRVAAHSRPRSSKSPAKASDGLARDVDLRILPVTDDSMKPDSTTNINKSSKDKLLSDLLNGEDMKSSHEMMITSDDNGKENKPILVVTINIQGFIVTAL